MVALTVITFEFEREEGVFSLAGPRGADGTTRCIEERVRERGCGVKQGYTQTQVQRWTQAWAQARTQA